MQSSLQRPTPTRQPCQPSTSSSRSFLPCRNRAPRGCRTHLAMHAAARPVGPVVNDWESLQAAYKVMVKPPQQAASKAPGSSKPPASKSKSSLAANKHSAVKDQKQPVTQGAQQQGAVASSSKASDLKPAKRKEQREQSVPGAARGSASTAKPADAQPAADQQSAADSSEGSSPAPFRGFGAPPPASPAVQAPVPPGKVLRLFRYSVEQTKIDQAIRDNGWQGRVVQVDSIQEADAIIAVKLTSGGKHQNLSQGERAAENAGVPFVVAGRQMTKDSLRRALGSMLASKSQ